VIHRAYQAGAASAVLQAFQQGKRAPLVVSPAGSGKTTIGAMLASHARGIGESVAWGAHRTELVDQAFQRLVGLGLTVGERGRDASAPCQVGMFQTWTRRGSAPQAGLFIADEAHHLAESNDWTSVLRAYLDGGARVVGLTATPARGDGQALEGFDCIVTATTIKALVTAGHLVPVVWRGPSRAMAKGQVARTPAEAYRMHAKGRSAVVFAPNVLAAEVYAKEFIADGIDARVVSDRTSPEERARILAGLADGSIPVVCNKDVLTEGWDCPRVSCVIVARKTTSQALWIQMTGRGLRPYPGKRDCLLLDCCGLAHSLGRPDDERTYHLDGDGIRLVNPPAVPLLERLCKVCGTPLVDGLVCAECRQDHSPEVPISAGEEMGAWLDRYAEAKALLQPSKSVLCLAGIMRKAREAAQRGNPWAKYAVQARFRGIMKRTPSGDEWRQAVELNEISDDGVASPRDAG
jgi:DNA repair protein RadD